MKRPKFHPMDLVRVRTPGRHEKLGSRPPGTLTMGKIATVEIAGLINGAAFAEGDSMAPAYYIRIDNLPAILIYEEWLEEAWAPLSPQIIYSSGYFVGVAYYPPLLQLRTPNDIYLLVGGFTGAVIEIGCAPLSRQTGKRSVLTD